MVEDLSSSTRLEVVEDSEVGRRIKLEAERSERIEEPGVGGEESGDVVAHGGSQTITEKERDKGREGRRREGEGDAVRDQLRFPPFFRLTDHHVFFRQGWLSRLGERDSRG